MRQMLAASSRISTIGGSSRPPARSAARRPARMTASVSAAISGAAAARDSVSRYRVSRLVANAAGVEDRQPTAQRRGDPGHDLLVVQAFGGGAGGLVDAVTGLRCAVLRAAQRGRQRAETRRRRAARRESGMRCRRASGPTSRSVRPEAGSGEQQGAQQVLGGGSPQVRLRPVVDGEHEMLRHAVRGFDGGQRRRADPTTSAAAGR